MGTKPATANRAIMALCGYWAILAFAAFAPVEFMWSRQNVLLVVIGCGVYFFSLAVSAIRGATRSAILADLDELTGLANRRAFTRDSHETLRQAPIGSMALVILDVDGLKTMNDDCGHASGDELLAAAGQRFANLNASAFRIGGDEFGLLVDRTRGDGVTAVLRGLEPFTKYFDACEHEHEIRVSYGYASNQKGDDFENLFQRADSRLRQFKRRLYRGGQLEERRANRRKDDIQDIVLGEREPASLDDRRRRRAESGLTLIS